MCRWDLSPAILLLFHPAAISCRLGLQIPPVTPPWGELAHGFGSSKPDRHWPGQAPREPRSRNADWGEKRKRQKGKGAEVLVLYGLYAEALSRTWGVQPKELCQVRRALHSPFPSSTFSWWSLRNTWSHLPPWAATLLKVIYWKSTYLGQESSLSSMAMVVGGSEWVSRDREYLRIRDTQTPVWSRRSLLCYQHILPKERQEIIWETEDHI